MSVAGSMIGSMTALPPIIGRYYDAATAGDLDAVLACFAVDAHVRDEGHDHVGHDAIRAWREGVATRFTYTSEITGVDAVEPDTYVVHTHLEGDFPGGVVDLEQRFTIVDGLIADLAI